MKKRASKRTSKRAIGGQTKGKQRATNKNDKNEKNDKNIIYINIYNQNCPRLPRVQKLTDKRKKAINRFLKEFTIEQFEEICKLANNSKFLTGDNDRNWKADFDFLMRIDKATNILEGKYSSSKNEKVDIFRELEEEF